jgi:hypothetical protein
MLIGKPQKIVIFPKKVEVLILPHILVDYTVKPELTTTSEQRPPVVYNVHNFEVPIRTFIT